MKLLILNDGRILAAGECEETDELLTYPEQIIPKHVLPEYQILDLDVPDDFSVSGYTYKDGQFLPVVAEPVVITVSET